MCFQKKNNFQICSLILSICLVDLIPYIPVNIFSVMSSWVEPVLRLMCLAQGHNIVTPVRLKPATPLSQVKHSTTEALRSLYLIYIFIYYDTDSLSNPKIAYPDSITGSPMESGAYPLR